MPHDSPAGLVDRRCAGFTRRRAVLVIDIGTGALLLRLLLCLLLRLGRCGCGSNASAARCCCACFLAGLRIVLLRLLRAGGPHARVIERSVQGISSQHALHRGLLRRGDPQRILVLHADLYDTYSQRKPFY